MSIESDDRFAVTESHNAAHGCNFGNTIGVRNVLGGGLQTAIGASDEKRLVRPSAVAEWSERVLRVSLLNS